VLELMRDYFGLRFKQDADALPAYGP